MLCPVTLDARGNTGWALTVGSETGLYRISLAATAAAATRIGAIACGEAIRGLALVETVTTDGVTVTAGQAITDGAINRAGSPASVVAAAYSNSFAGTGTTALYQPRSHH